MKAPMMAALLLTAAAGVTGVVLQPGAPAPSEQMEAVSEAPARVKPPQAYAATVVATAEDCPGVTVANGTGLLCVADKEAQVVDAAPALADRERLYSCPPTEDRAAYLAWHSVKDVCPGGVLIGTPTARVSLPGLETDLDAALREACRPCQVSAGHWGVCPACLHVKGGCAAVCKAADEAVTEVTP